MTPPRTCGNDRYIGRRPVALAPDGHDDERTSRPQHGTAHPLAILLAFALIGATLATISAAIAPAGAQPGTIDLGGGLGRPGEPAPVDMTAVSNTPVRGQWGVTGLDPDRTVNYDTEVWDFAVIGERIYVAGAFLNVQRNRNATPIPRPYLAAFDLYTGEWDPGFQPQIDGSVWALEVSPRGTLLVGGEFTAVDGRPDTAGLTSLDPVTGAYDTLWAGSVERPWSSERAVVRSLEVVGNALYVAGNFSHVRGATQSQRTRVYKVARVDASFGTPDATFKPEVTGAGVWGFGIDTENQMMHLAGFFSSVGGGANTNDFASVDLVTGDLRTDLVPLARNSTGQKDMFDVEVAGGKIWAGGSEHIVHVMDDATRALLGWHTTGFRSPDNFTWSMSGRISFAGGDYQVVEEVGDFVIAGCHCNAEEGRGILSHYSSFDDARFRTLMVEAYEADTGRLVSTFVPDLASSIEGAWAVHSDGLGCLLVGGDFELGGLKTGSSFWLGNWARFCPPGVELGPDTESPSIPANVVATSPGAAGTESVTVTWDASSDNRTVVGYNVFRDGEIVATVDATTFTDTGLGAGTYGYRIQAIDSSDNRSAGSPTVTVTVSGPDTDPPTLPTDLQTQVDATDVTLTWNPSTDPSGLDGYAIYRNGAYIGWTRTATYTDTSLTNGTYTYSLRAYDNLGNRTTRVTFDPVTIGAPDTDPPTLPTDLQTQVDATDVTLTWNPSTDPSGLDGYAIYRNGAYIGWTRTATYTDTSLTNGTYTYSLRAYDNLGNRTTRVTFDPVTIGAPDTDPPTLPTDLQTQVDATDVTLTWNPSTDPSGLDGYAIYRNGAYIGWTRTATYTDTSLTNGTYTYALRAYDNLGNRTTRVTFDPVTIG